MKKAVIGANGKSGRLLVKEDVERGHEVTAIVRNDYSGESQISYADYAIAVMDEAEKGGHIQSRFTVVSE